jgi:polysaccharide pyruvyl transferase WcaK-like protein
MTDSRTNYDESFFLSPDHKSLSQQVSQKPNLIAGIALLTPYNGGNLGDAAIQDAMIDNLRLRLADARFTGISLDCESFLDRHGAPGFPLCATGRPFYEMSSGNVAANPNHGAVHAKDRNVLVGRILGFLKKLPGLLKLLKKMRRWALILPGEILHCARGYKLLSKQDILIVSGGGQLDEEWGGSWGHPFALFKWALLARVARVPCAFVSVGAGKLKSPVTRLLLFMALRLASYHSYRDKNTKAIVATLFKKSVDGEVVPDLAFSLSIAGTPLGAKVRSFSKDQTVVAIGLIAFAKPGCWPHEDDMLYHRYLRQMARTVSFLMERGHSLIIVCSSLGDDESVMPDLLECLDELSQKRFSQQARISTITTWKELTATLLEVDYLIGSRLHTTIFGFLTHKPTIAISFDPKVNWLMQDIGQTDYLLQIHDFTAEDVLKAIDHIQLNRLTVVEKIMSYRQKILPGLQGQYDALARLAGLHRGLQN